MRLKVYTFQTTIPEPGETRPQIPNVFTDQARAEAYADKVLREEWESAKPHDVNDQRIPYPKDWRMANQVLADLDEDGVWGEYDMTEHWIEVPEAVVRQIKRETGVMGWFWRLWEKPAKFEPVKRTVRLTIDIDLQDIDDDEREKLKLDFGIEDEDLTRLVEVTTDDVAKAVEGIKSDDLTELLEQQELDVYVTGTRVVESRWL